MIAIRRASEELFDPLGGALIHEDMTAEEFNIDSIPFARRERFGHDLGTHHVQRIQQAVADDVPPSSPAKPPPSVTTTDWNPQRIEQRIGRCHRYGQQHDVVVVNFLNRRNEADLRVFQLLSEKFQLFDGVFGASDEVLGALESGVDIERRIAQVYQECRSTDEIQSAFDELQAELEEQIQSRMAQTREALLDNFDEDVHARLKVHRKQAFSSLSDRERWLLSLTQHELSREPIGAE